MLSTEKQRAIRENDYKAIGEVALFCLFLYIIL